LSLTRKKGVNPATLSASWWSSRETTARFKIPLAGTLDPGAGIILMMHDDAGTKGTFDPKEDRPTMEGGKPVMAEVKIE
jgi:hypothetical protein